MHKKVISLLLSLLILVNFVLPVMADETEDPKERYVRIINVGGLQTLAKHCRLDSYSENLVVSIHADLDLEGKAFEGIPIFCGRFEGNGHTISGLNLTKEGSVQGFFRYLTESAVVNDLHLEGVVQPEGSAGIVGGFAGENSGILRNCSFSGTVSGKENIGGIVGDNTITGTIENCRVSGNVFGGHFVGGIAGKNGGTIRFCENKAVINETARKNQVELSDITLNSALHSEAASTVTDVGGIAGNSTGVIRECINDARVGYPSMGYNIGGIAGTQSGSILDCENRGVIYGRKEVGGIVGQMEPSSVMKFEEDALQILGRQLDSLGNSVSKAASNLQGAGEDILEEVDDVFDHVWNAQNAVQALIPDLENPTLPDLDALLAAKNNIGSSISGMINQMDGISATAYSALGKVNSNLHEISDQINKIRATISNISETTGGTVVDRSDEDTEEDLSGKVAQCRNAGNIYADLNCGGIAGAMALENDLDIAEDWKIMGENSLNFESEIRAVILDCENSGKVFADKENVGGIVGLQSLGLVKLSRNTGTVGAESADYAGGISGRSMGFIRSAYAKGEVSGRSYVGGIAGSAAVASACNALVRIHNGVENIGAILGGKEENRSKVENPIAENYYLVLLEDPGAIDGISYNGQAQPLPEEEFFLQENLPKTFQYVTVTFRYDDQSERKFILDFGKKFPDTAIPSIPVKDGRMSCWKGLEDADLSAVFFDLVFEQEYTDQTTVLESTLERNEIPLMLVQGVFTEDAELHAESLQEKISLEKREKLLEIWKFHTTEPDSQTQIRLQLPEGADAENFRILIRGADSSWREEPYHVLGRYAIASLTSGDNGIAVVQTAEIPWLLMIALTVAVVLTGILIIRKRRTADS